MATKTTVYSAKNVVAMLDGLRVFGLWDGDDAIAVAPLADKGQMMVGAQGESIFSQSANRGVTITLRLMHTGPTHARLIQLMLLQEQGVGNGFSFAVMDTRSGEGGTTDQAFIQSAPGDQKGVNAAVREWVLVSGDWIREIPIAA